MAGDGSGGGGGQPGSGCRTETPVAHSPNDAKLEGPKIVTYALRNFVIASVCCALFAAVCVTQATAQEGGYKIGVVDMQQVLAKYNKRKAKYDDLQKQVDALQAGIDSKSKAIEAAKADYEKKRATLSSEELSALELKIRSDYVDYQAELTRSQQKIDSMEEEVLKQVLKDVQEKVEAIAASGNYHLILNRTGGNSTVLFAAPQIDITSQVLEQLNK